MLNIDPFSTETHRYVHITKQSNTHKYILFIECEVFQSLGLLTVRLRDLRYQWLYYLDYCIVFVKNPKRMDVSVVPKDVER